MAGWSKRRFRYPSLRPEPWIPSEKNGALCGEEPNVLEKRWCPDEDDEVSDEDSRLEPGRFCLIVLSRWASTRLKLRLSRPC